jgi:hypothetical protein
MISNYRKNIVLIIAILCLKIPDVRAQDKFYTSTGFEMLFSWANIEENGIQNPSIVRWAPVINIQTFFNYDASRKFGIFSGIGVRNVGFIYDVDDATRRKVRTYNMGIPLGIKVGNVEKFFGYIGYEFEIAFNYRERNYVSNQKSVFNEWFSDRVPLVHNSILVGVQFPKGVNLKFKYYPTNFYNKDYVEIDQETAEPIKPYENLDVNVFFISVGFNLFRDKNLYFMD